MSTDYITIALTKGNETIIDTIDADLATLKWFSDHNYARRQSKKVKGKQSPIYLHKIILERKIGRSLTDTERTDHIDGNTLDNRRDNLRVASIRDNNRNAKRRKDSGSGLKGVSWHKRIGKWQARIWTDEGRKHLGYFDNPEDAYEAYCQAAPIYHGDFNRLE